MRHWMFHATLVAVILLGMVSNAAAGDPTAVAVPEISPTSISAGLAILAGGVLMFRARRGR
jgi:hypothetical protein